MTVSDCSLLCLHVCKVRARASGQDGISEQQLMIAIYDQIDYAKWHQHKAKSFLTLYQNHVW